jgi:hypothetical protein
MPARRQPAIRRCKKQQQEFIADTDGTSPQNRAPTAAPGWRRIDGVSVND